MFTPKNIFNKNYLCVHPANTLDWSKIGCRLNNGLLPARIPFCKAWNSLALVAQPSKWKLFQNHFTLHLKSLPEQSFHAIVNLFTCQRNKPTLPFWQSYFQSKINAYVWNEGYLSGYEDTGVSFSENNILRVLQLTENCKGLWLEGVAVIWWHSEKIQN